MSSALSLPVLVMNKSWVPIRVATVREALLDLSKNACTVLDHENYIAYDWQGWTDLPVIGDQKFVRTVSRNVRAPSIMLLVSYNKVPNFEVKLNMKNIWLRDGGRCQYTGKKLPLHEATKDHIIPESRGGQDSWENLVTCCPIVNKRKAARTPREAGLTLLSVPKKPKWTPLYSAMYSTLDIPQGWSKFLPKLTEHELFRQSEE